jgi:hypothetical protein
VPSAGAERARFDAVRVSTAGEQSAEGRARVRCLGATLVPSDETCFVLFEAPAAEDVRRILDAASAPYDRIVESIQVGPGDKA